MSITRQDVKIVYDDPPVGVIATPPGSGLIASLASGVPLITGVGGGGVPDLFLDFNDGPSNATLGINLAGSLTAYGDLPWRKHSWVPTGGFDGGGFIRMHWFTGMSIGFSPVQIEVPGGFAPHFEIKYMVRQSDTMVHGGSAIKLLRLIDNGSRSMGTLEWGNYSGAYGPQRWKWYYDDWAIAPPGPGPVDRQLCVWDIAADPGSGCGPDKIDDLVATGWHEYKVECNFNDPEASIISTWVDGVALTPFQLPPESQADGGPNIVPTPGARFDISPFAEMYSCGDGGPCSSGINTGDFDVDHFSYTILP